MIFVQSIMGLTYGPPPLTVRPLWWHVMTHHQKCFDLCGEWPRFQKEIYILREKKILENVTCHWSFGQYTLFVFVLLVREAAETSSFYFPLCELHHKSQCLNKRLTYCSLGLRQIIDKIALIFIKTICIKPMNYLQLVKACQSHFEHRPTWSFVEIAVKCLFPLLVYYKTNWKPLMNQGPLRAPSVESLSLT